MFSKFTIEMEVPIGQVSTWLQVGVVPEGSLETFSRELAVEGLKYWRTQFPVSSFRLLEWVPAEVKI